MTGEDVVGAGDDGGVHEPSIDHRDGTAVGEAVDDRSCVRDLRFARREHAMEDGDLSRVEGGLPSEAEATRPGRCPLEAFEVLDPRVGPIDGGADPGESAGEDER